MVCGEDGECEEDDEPKKAKAKQKKPQASEKQPAYAKRSSERESEDKKGWWSDPNGALSLGTSCALVMATLSTF